MAVTKSMTSKENTIPQIIAYDQQALEAIKRGVRTLSRAVTKTLGPRGRNVLIQQGYGPPVVTKDGVTVAKEIDLEDPFENIGARMVREPIAWDVSVLCSQISWLRRSSQGDDGRHRDIDGRQGSLREPRYQARIAAAKRSWPSKASHR